MGQRTTTIILTESVKGRKNVKVYHDQWGIGRKSYLDLITISNAVYNLDYNADICKEIFIPKNTSNAFQIYELEYYKNGKCKKFFDTECNKNLKASDAPSWDDWFNSFKIGDFIKHNCDNNNGGMVVYIKETKTEDSFRTNQNITAKWLLGTEDHTRTYEINGEVITDNPENKIYGEAYSMFLTAHEYANLEINRRFADSPFMDVFDSFCKYFEIETEKK